MHKCESSKKVKGINNLTDENETSAYATLQIPAYGPYKKN